MQEGQLEVVKKHLKINYILFKNNIIDKFIIVHIGFVSYIQFFIKQNQKLIKLLDFIFEI